MLFNRKSENRSGPAPGRKPEPRPEPQRTLEPLPEARRVSTNPGTRSQSFIDASLTILGDLHSDGDVQLDGRVCGNVSCAQLIVGREAAITGAVAAEQAVIRGCVTGTIRSPLVILQDSARVESDITYTVLAIDDGASFEGTAHRCDNPLEETEAVSPLADLQRIALAAAQTGTPNGSAGHGFGNGSGSGAARPEPEARGRDPAAVLASPEAPKRPPEY
jgi:cytoskeletal protein CcmA (bactofilin family)